MTKRIINDNQRRGPWSKEEKTFIAQSYTLLSPEQIAKHLRRNVTVVRKYIREFHGSTFTESAKNAEYDIQRTPVWADLQQQFSEEELKMFLYHWGRIISQFREDVYPTEELQVVDTIKLEIMMNRCLRQQHQCMRDVGDMEQRLQNEKAKDSIEQDTQVISSLERQIGVLRAAQESLNSDFKTMLSEKNKILDKMKATRDSRIKHLESNKHNFFAFIAKILSDKMLRYRLGVDMEKMRLATEVEYERLSNYHEYANGEVDQPLLTPENIIDEE